MNITIKNSTGKTHSFSLYQLDTEYGTGINMEHLMAACKKESLSVLNDSNFTVLSINIKIFYQFIKLNKKEFEYAKVNDVYFGEKFSEGYETVVDLVKCDGDAGKIHDAIVAKVKNRYAIKRNYGIYGVSYNTELCDGEWFEK